MKEQEQNEVEILIEAVDTVTSVLQKINNNSEVIGKAITEIAENNNFKCRNCKTLNKDLKELCENTMILGAIVGKLGDIFNALAEIT
jgi:hypothetical protein